VYTQHTTYHVPDVVGEPVDDAVETADDLQVFGFDRSFIDEKYNEGGGNEGHGTDSEDCYQYIRPLLTGNIHTHKHKHLILFHQNVTVITL